MNQPEQKATWQDKFYQLADKFLESDLLLTYCVSKMLRSRKDLQDDFDKEISPTHADSLAERSKQTVRDIIEGKQPLQVITLPLRLKRQDEVKKMRRKQMQRPNLSKGLGLE